MVAKDLMRRDVFTIGDHQTIEELVHVLVREHIQGCPVVDKDGRLVGVVTQQDVFFGDVTRRGGGSAMRVGELMTSPAVSASEDTDILAVCRMMHRLRIHRVPIVKDGKVTGIVSALDVIGELAQGRTIG
jgi:IMP dehydrogenase